MQTLCADPDTPVDCIVSNLLSEGREIHVLTVSLVIDESLARVELAAGLRADEEYI